jgi:hypothetical protein
MSAGGWYLKRSNDPDRVRGRPAAAMLNRSLGPLHGLRAPNNEMTGARPNRPPDDQID